MKIIYTRDNVIPIYSRNNASGMFLGIRSAVHARLARVHARIDILRWIVLQSGFYPQNIPQNIFWY